MATPRVTFSATQFNEAVESSLAASAENLDEILPTAALAVFERLSHLIITPERLTFVDHPVSHGYLCSVYFAKLDETSQAPRDVAVEHLNITSKADRDRRIAIRLARQLKVWEGLRHPNILELLGYYLSPNHDTAQLISPYLINGGLGDYLAENPSGIAQRLGFARDITSGLDYLHSHSPPIIHNDLRPINILIDENLNAVLSGFGQASTHSDLDDPSGLTTSDGLKGVLRYTSPELIVEDKAKKTLASDILAWGCTVFEILTRDQPFQQYRYDTRVLTALIQRSTPGSPEKLLSLVPDAPKPEYASSLRLLHSYIPLCWEYEPRKRPSISLVRRQAFVFSFESDVGDSVVATLNELAHLLIPPERLRLVERSELGSGNYGEVVLGTLDESSPTPRDVAVKRLKAVGTRGERVRLAKRLARELNIWAKIKHPNVVELIGYHLDEKYESPLLISELMVNGNVLNYIERFKPDTEQRVSFVKGITAGLACLHSFDPPICHADLKPANVLIDLHMNAVLCDFGLASFVSGSGASPGLVTSTTLKGSPRYMSPELLMEDEYTHSLESDVWAWGCTVFQVLTGYTPYAEAVGEGPFYLAIAQKKLPGDVALLLPKNSESTTSGSSVTLRFLYVTLPQCWDFHPRKRPSVCTLLSHISRPPPQTERESKGIEDVPSNNLPSDEGTSSLVKLQNPPREGPVDDEGSPGDKLDIPTNAYPGGEKVAEDYLRNNQEEAQRRESANAGEQRYEDHSIGKNQVTEITPNRNTAMASTFPLSAFILGIACILALGAILYQFFGTFYSLFQQDQEAGSTNYSFLKTSAPPLSTLVLAAACTVSLSGNIYQFVRKKDTFPPRDQAARPPNSQEQQS